ncbi:MAG: hypothetical protein WKF62_02930 [Solirubrobacterales bacterium]
MNRARRIAFLLAATIATMLLSAPIAMGADGEGLYGRTNDMVITIFCFGVIIFFTLFVIGMSILQHRLEGRKERVREDIERLRKP